MSRKVVNVKGKTAIMAVPTSLRRYIISVQMELQSKVKGKKNKKITLLQAGLEVNKRLRK